MTIKLYENGVNRNNSCSISNWIAALLITLISTLSFSLFLSLSLSLSLPPLFSLPLLYFSKYHYVKNHITTPYNSLLRRLVIMRLHQQHKIVTYSNYANEWNEISSRFFPIREPQQYKLRATRES